MDPFTIATGVAGLLSLTSDIVQILTDYTGGVKSAARDARSVLTEVTALSHVLQQLIEFLRKDDTNSKCRFRNTSALCSVIAICRNHIETLYRKVKFRGKPENDLLGRLKWPFEKQDCQEIVEVLHRCSQTFTFSLQIANCELLSQTSTEVVARLDEEKEKLDSITSMFPTIPTEMKDMRNTLVDIRTFVSIKLTSELEKISISVEGLEKGLHDDQRMKILDWLSPLQPQKRHQDVQSMRLNNTGGWLLNDKRFMAWCTREQGLEPEDRMLCCYGMPGAGKTIMCSAVVDFLRGDMQHLQKGSVGIACFYCDYRDQTTQQGPQIIGSLVVQFLAGLLEVPVNIVKTFMDAQKNHTKLELRQGLSMLESLVKTYDNPFLCIDAIDELEIETQQALLQAIQELLSSSGGQKTRVLFTGRPHIKPHILQHFSGLRAATVLSTDREIEIVASEDDISCFLSHYIETKDPMPDKSAMNAELRCKIITTITEKSGGMFLLPALHIQAILEEPTIGDREDALHKLPDKLHGAFEKTISRIGSQPQTRAAQGMMVLTWVFLAKCPLSLEELQHALAVRTEVEVPKAFDAKRLCSRDILLGSCLGLVIVDDETSTVRLVHFSLQEFLARRAQEISVGPGHTSVAKMCLKYLQFYCSELTCHHTSSFRECRSPSSCSCQKKYPLLKYAATEWGHHAREGHDPSINSLALNWLTTAGGLDMCAFRLLCQRGCKERLNCLSELYADGVYRCNATILHHAAYFGEPGIFHELYNHLRWSSSTVDLNTKDNHDWTPLTWAASRGHTALVTLLSNYDELELDADHPCGALGRTPLSYAAIIGNVDIVARLLTLTPRVNPDHRDQSGSTPLSLSAKNGHAGIVRLLVGNPGVDPNSQDLQGDTPLSLAMQFGRMEVVQALLEDARLDPNREIPCLSLIQSPEPHGPHQAQLPVHEPRLYSNLQEPGGNKPLEVAIEVYDKGIADLLVVSSNINTMGGKTLLHWAVAEGRERLIQLLMLHPLIDPNVRQKDGMTPLDIALRCRRTSVLRLLLQNHRVDPNLYSQDQYAQVALFAASEIFHMGMVETAKTALHVAVCESFDTGMVEVLLQCPRVDPNLQQKDGKTPLHLAISEDCDMRIVEALIQCARVDPNLPQKDGKTPLHIAILGKQLYVIRLLLQNHRIDPNLQDTAGRAPLHSTVLGKDTKVIQWLLQDPRVDPNLQDTDGRTPLHSAAWRCYLKVTECLLRDPRVDPNLQDTDGRTPLHCTVFNKDPEVIQCLLQDLRVDPNLQDTDGRTPLHSAIWRGFLKVTECLLRDSRVDPNLRDTDGRTPLHYTIFNKDLEVIQCLLQDPRVDPNLQDTDGRAPLHIAVFEKDPKVTQYLLQDPRVDSNLQDTDGRTPLHSAVWRGFLKVTECLLRDSRVDPNLQDTDGRTPLHYTIFNKDLEVTQCLLQDLRVDPNLQDTDGRRPLHSTVFDKDPEVIQWLLQDPRLDLNLRKKNGRTPLHFAVFTKDPEVIQCLLQDPRVDPNLQDTNGQSPLHIAVFTKDPEVIQCLLQDPRLDLNLRNKNGRTPLHIAVFEKDPEVIQCLLQSPRLDLNLRNKNGRTPLHSAVFTKDPEVIQCLLQDPRLDLNLQDTDGRAPLHIAVFTKHPEVIQCLLQDPRLDLNPQNKNGRTPLHSAVFIKDPEVIQCLLQDHRVDPNLQDTDGRTPLHSAAFQKDPEVIQSLLRDPRVDPNVKNYDGFPPLMLVVHRYKGADIHKLISNLLSEPRISLEAKDKCGRTALSLAAATALAFELEPQSLEPFNESLPSASTGSVSRRGCRALEDRQTCVLQALLRNGADPHTRDDEGRSPLDWAMSLGDLKSTSCIDLLQKYMSGELTPTGVAGRKRKIATPWGAEPSGKRLALKREYLGRQLSHTLAYGHGQNN